MNENNESLDFSDEQKQKLKELKNSALKKSIFIGMKYASLLLLANLLVIVIDVFYVRSLIFVFAGAFINGIFISRTASKDVERENNRVREELKKILEIK